MSSKIERTRYILRYFRWRIITVTEKKRLTTNETAKMMNVCQQRIAAKIRQGHFPNYGHCECGRTVMIPMEDIENDLKYRGSQKK